MKITKVFSDYVITENDIFIVCNSGSALALYLPSASATENSFYIKNIGAGAVTITPHSPDLLDGASSVALAQYESAIVFDYDTNVWIKI